MLCSADKNVTITITMIIPVTITIGIIMIKIIIQVIFWTSFPNLSSNSFFFLLLRRPRRCADFLH